MAPYSRSHSSSSDEPSQREVDLADLYDSDEDVESLLAGGADVSDLIAAGVLEDDDQPEGLETTEEFMARTERERQESSEQQIFYTDEEAKAVLEESRQLLNRFSRGSLNASSQPN